jgi:PiT family inorganic phosphate transporter
VGAYAGSAIASYIWHFGFFGVETVLKAEGWIKTIIFIVLSPLIGMLLGFVLMVAVYWIFHRVSVNRVDRVFRVGQLFSAAAYSLGHGGNDAQKTMGIITIVLVSGGYLSLTPDGKLPDVPIWVEVAACAAIALGTLSGGWRIVKTMGTKIVKLQPVGGFCAETAGAMTLFGATAFGPHHHRLYSGCRFRETFLRRKMGSSRTYRLGVGLDDPDGGGDRRAFIRISPDRRNADRKDIRFRPW